MLETERKVDVQGAVQRSRKDLTPNYVHPQVKGSQGAESPREQRVSRPLTFN